MVEFPFAKVLDPYGGQQLDPVDPVDPGAGVVASVWASANDSNREWPGSAGETLREGEGGKIMLFYVVFMWGSLDIERTWGSEHLRAGCARRCLDLFWLQILLRFSRPRPVN